MNRQFFESEKSKRTSKIFRKMSNEIKTRSSLQCRSHHQKYEANNPKIDDLIEYLSNRFTIEAKSAADNEKVNHNNIVDP